MVKADKVEVYLQRHSDGFRYEEYTPPVGSLRYTGNANESYIEAQTDERFKVMVKLLPRFKFMGSPKVQVEYFVDRGSCWLGTLSKRTSQYHREDALDLVPQFVNGKYMDCGLTFGELRSDESVTLGDQQIAEEADQTGRIVVKLRRGHFANRKAAEDSEVQSFDPPEHVDLEATCKEVVHKHQVSHVLKHISVRPSPAAAGPSSGYQREWVRATGPGSEPIVFTIRYHSRKALIALGIIEETSEDASATGAGETAPNQQSREPDNTRENFILSARPTMSPTPSQAPGITGQTPSGDPTARHSPSHPVRSMLSEDDDDDEDDDSDDDDLERNFGYDDDGSEDHSADGSDVDNSSEGETVGPGHATPPRHGDVSTQRESSEQQRKRAWSEVLREEAQLDAEEAAATSERQKREEKREKLAAAKRQFLNSE